jgi:hemolysin III
VPVQQVTVNEYTFREEVANALTHSVGAVLSVAALCVMVVYAVTHRDAPHVVGASVFGGTMVLLYGASTLYHSFQHPTAKQIFRILDHSCIYLLIAGTYTPFTLLVMPVAWGWSLFGVVWGLAVAGIIFKIFCIERLELLCVGVYLGMGWLGIIAAKPLLEVLPLAGILWTAGGGLMYTFGVIFYAWERLPFNHAVWHLFVMAGTFCHFVAIYWYVLPN